MGDELGIVNDSKGKKDLVELQQKKKIAKKQQKYLVEELENVNKKKIQRFSTFLNPTDMKSIS